MATDSPSADAGDVLQLPSSMLDTITAHYSGSGGRPVRWVRAATPATVSLVIPAGTEARDLEWVLEQVPDEVDEIILVDGHAGDEAVADRPGIRIVTVDSTGEAGLQHGLRLATGDIIVMMTADGRMEPREIRHYLHFLANGYDFVKGSRFACGGGSTDLTPVRRIGNRLLLAAFHRRYDANITDLCYGFCAFHRRIIGRLDLPGCQTGAEITVRAVQAGLRIAEVPSLEMPRRTSKSSVDEIRDGIRMLSVVLRRHHRLVRPA